jgi:hypothetical protein
MYWPKGLRDRSPTVFDTYGFVLRETTRFRFFAQMGKLSLVKRRNEGALDARRRNRSPVGSCLEAQLMPRTMESSMNHSIYSIDRVTHLRIVVVAVAAAITMVSITASSYQLKR